jgi:uncharacterized membrane protein
MTQIEENKTLGNSFLETKLGKVAATLVAVLLIFAGPTYFVYGLAEVLKVNLAASVAVGFVLLVVGLFLMRFLVQKKIIS